MAQLLNVRINQNALSEGNYCLRYIYTDITVTISILFDFRFLKLFSKLDFPWEVTIVLFLLAVQNESETRCCLNGSSFAVALRIVIPDLPNTARPVEHFEVFGSLQHSIL